MSDETANDWRSEDPAMGDLGELCMTPQQFEQQATFTTEHRGHSTAVTLATRIGAWQRGRGPGTGRQRRRVLEHRRLAGLVAIALWRRGTLVAAVLVGTLMSLCGPVAPASASLPSTLYFPLAADTNFDVADGAKVLIEERLTLRAGERRRVFARMEAFSATNTGWLAGIVTGFV